MRTMVSSILEVPRSRTKRSSAVSRTPLEERNDFKIPRRILLRQEIFQTKSVEKIKTRFSCST